MTAERLQQGVTPIILVGMNRTGTKWVSNILSRHPEIVSIQSERARGILETNMLGIMQTKFDLSSPDDYIGLIELWSATEFFRTAGVEKEYFYDQDVRPRSVTAVFELLMNEVARRAGKSFWLQKTSPLLAGPTLDYFRHARVIIVRRDLVDTLRSTWRLNQRRGDRRVIRSVYAYVRQKKVLAKVSRKYDAVEIDYDRLRQDPGEEIRRLFRGLGLEPVASAADVGFERNTSFEGDAQRQSIMSAGERLLAQALAVVFNLVPLFLIEAGVWTVARFTKPKPKRLMSGTFGALFDALKDKSSQ